jgi:peptide/nickel transport system permease protein
MATATTTSHTPVSPKPIVDQKSVEKGRSPLRVSLSNFFSHRPAVVGLCILAVLYFVAIFAEFVAPYNYDEQNRDLLWTPPSSLKFSDEQGFSWRPFTYPIRSSINDNFEIVTTPDTSQRLYLRFFAKADKPYRMWGLIPLQTRLFGFDPAPEKSATGDTYFSRFYLLGSDVNGRCIFSRICYGARVSMTIGLLGASIVFVIGMLVGGISGYFGGWVDNLLQRFCEMLMLLPGFYLLLMLRFLFRSDMSSVTVYFAVVLILALVGWAPLARVIRNMVLSIRGNDYIQAARAIGQNDFAIIVKHVLPNTLSYAIVAVTLAIPGYILSESALSVLGLGIMEPMPSWGNMLQKATELTELSQHPWVLWPGFFIFIAIMAFNLVGDGLRDAFDPKLRKRD